MLMCSETESCSLIEALSHDILFLDLPRRHQDPKKHEDFQIDRYFLMIKNNYLNLRESLRLSVFVANQSCHLKKHDSDNPSKTVQYKTDVQTFYQKNH